MNGEGIAFGGSTPPVDAAERLREIAFAVILTEARAATKEELEALAGGQVGPLLDALASQGSIDRAADGQVSGSAGLSLSHGPHRLAIEARAFRTWCAYDAIGIPAALEADAAIDTACGVCDRAIHLAMVNGRASRRGPEVLWLADDSNDLRTAFCTPTVILCGPEHGAIWADRQANRGNLVSLAEAADRGALAWSGYAGAVRRLGQIEYVGGPRDGTAGARTSLPDVIADGGGQYRRSVRCADDGAMRYVWRIDAREAE